MVSSAESSKVDVKVSFVSSHALSSTPLARDEAYLPISTAAAIETAKIIAAKSPIALRGTKALLLHARDHS